MNGIRLLATAWSRVFSSRMEAKLTSFSSRCSDTSCAGSAARERGQHVHHSGLAHLGAGLGGHAVHQQRAAGQHPLELLPVPVDHQRAQLLEDRKSTRLNSSHVAISYAVFCLKK